MADYTIPNLDTVVVGVVTTTAFQYDEFTTPVFETSNGTVSIGNEPGSSFEIITTTQPGWFGGRRPQTGQLFPRGVYNK